MHIVIHCLGNTPDGNALCRQHGAITQGIVTADHYQAIQFKKVQVCQHLAGEVDPVVRCMVGSVGFQVRRQVAHARVRRVCARGLQDRAALPIDGARIQLIQWHQIVTLPCIGVIGTKNQLIAAA